MKYFIYHPIGGSLNSECSPGLFQYEHVFSVEANSFAEAFRFAQNFNEEYSKLDLRSTSIGDIIQSEEDRDKHECHLIKGNGFQCVPVSWLTFIDWGNTIPQSKVFVVFFDNGLSYEDHKVSLRKIYFSEEKAKQFVEKKNAELQKEFNPPTREEFALMDIEDTYEDYIDCLMWEYSLRNSGKYFYYGHEVE